MASSRLRKDPVAVDVAADDRLPRQRQQLPQLHEFWLPKRAARRLGGACGSGIVEGPAYPTGAVAVPAEAGPPTRPSRHYQGNLMWAVPEHAGKVELAQNLVKFKSRIPDHIKRVAALSTTRADCNGWKVEPNHAWMVSKGLSGLLRHSSYLDVNLLGFAWVQDVIDELAQMNGIVAYFAVIFHTAARDRDERTQVVYLPATSHGAQVLYDYYQGHAGPWRQYSAPDAERLRAHAD